ncbi:cytochrome P450 2C20-like [Glandiceps talaboti]
MKYLAECINLLTTVLLFCVTFLIVTYVRTLRKWNYPPGPLGWPIIGSLGSLGQRPYITFTEMAKAYGDVFSLKLGNRLVVVLNGYDAIREAFVGQGHKFSGRPDLAAQDVLTKALTFSDYGKRWHDQRQFMLKTLRAFGVGKRNVEEIVHTELNHLTEFLENLSEKPSDVGHVLECVIANVVCKFGFGQRFNYDDPKFNSTLRNFATVAALVENSGAVNFLPFLRHIPGQDKVKEIIELKAYTEDFVREIVEEHRAKFDPEVINDFTDAYLLEMSKYKDDVDTTFTDQVMVDLLLDLFSASTVTTSDTMIYAVLLMGTYPEIQKRIQTEIDNGNDILPCLANKRDMPYTQATVLEILRAVAPSPLAIPHSATEDVSLRGYDIPKGTVVFANLWSSLNDPKYWKNPQVFDPTRFIGENGEMLKNRAFIPFSLGSLLHSCGQSCGFYRGLDDSKRACTGENLAKMNLFLLLTTLLKRFDLTFPDNANKPTLEGQPGISLRPYPFEICFKKRTGTYRKFPN